MLWKQKEKQIQLLIMQYLKNRRYFFMRVNNTPIFDSKINRYRKMPTYCIKGFPDIQLFYNDKVYLLEVKTKEGRQSEHQKEFEEQINKNMPNNAIYKIVTSVEDIIRLGL